MAQISTVFLEQRSLVTMASGSDSLVTMHQNLLLEMAKGAVQELPKLLFSYYLGH